MTKQVSVIELIPTMIADLERSTEETREEAVRITAETSQEMSDYASQSAPVSKGSGKGGHHLRDAIELTPSRYNTGINARFYSSAKRWHKYSIVHLLELGHLKPFGGGLVPARPFMGPALEKYRPILDQRIEELLSRNG